MLLGLLQAEPASKQHELCRIGSQLVVGKSKPGVVRRQPGKAEPVQAPQGIKGVVRSRPLAEDRVEVRVPVFQIAGDEVIPGIDTEQLGPGDGQLISQGDLEAHPGGKKFAADLAGKGCGSPSMAVRNSGNVSSSRACAADSTTGST